jgi:4-hydroxythreonine-4-phosphate dehydrogenase
MQNFIKLGISLGDPNGIGPEIILKALSEEDTLNGIIPIIYSELDIIEFYLNHLSIKAGINIIDDPMKAKHGILNIFQLSSSNFKIHFGQQKKESGQVAFQSLSTASKHALKNLIDAIVTAPIDKNTIQGDNFNFNGHTEYLTSITNKNQSLMLMAHGKLKVGIVTNHLSIDQVSKAITVAAILNKIRLMDQSLKGDFKIKNPKIGLLGLNPHSGDGGLIGQHEVKIIQPAIEQALEKGFNVSGPFSADGFFASGNYKEYDGILGMYHDQGLIPFKILSKNQGVNFTAGLQIIRTSPDHGTAYEIAGKNKASYISFKKAMLLAKQIYLNRAKY